MTNSQYNNENLTTKNLDLEIRKLKELYKKYAGGIDYKGLDEDQQKEKNELYQNLLEKEYELQEVRKKLAGPLYKEPGKGDWIIGKNKYGYKRYKLMYDNNAGW